MISGARTSCQIILDLDVLLRSHAKEGCYAVAVVVSVGESPAHWGDGGLVDVGHGLPRNGGEQR